MRAGVGQGQLSKAMNPRARVVQTSTEHLMPRIKNLEMAHERVKKDLYKVPSNTQAFFDPPQI